MRGSPGAVLRWDPVVDGGLRIRGRVVVPGVELMPRFFVWAEHPSLTSGWRPEDGMDAAMALVDTVTSDEGGRFEFVRCSDAPHRLRIALVNQPMFDLFSIEDVLPGGEELVIELDAARLPSVRLKGRVVDGQGQPVAFARVSPTNDDALTLPVLKARADGTFDLGEFPPGRWGIFVGFRLRTELVEVGPHETHDFGDLIGE